MTDYDVIVIGAGMIGSFTAYRLSRYDLRVLVLEQAGDLGEGAAKANSGILYPGFHPRGGSLKGISCVQGNRMYDDICAELGIPMRRVGSLYVAFQPEGEALMLEKMEKGKKSGVPGMRVLSGDESRAIEPMLSKNVTKALYAPTTALISPFTLILALAQSACHNGVSFQFDTKVTGLQPLRDGALVQTSAGELRADYVVNAAGEEADVLEGLVRPQELVITPRRGQFYVFDKSLNGTVKHVLYQAQDSDEGGTLLAPTVEGNLIAGPTSENVPSYRHTATTAAGLAHIERVAKKILPDLDFKQVITNFAGMRTNIVNVEKGQKDFILRESVPRIFSALGIKNPGMTSAPYLSARLLELLAARGLPLHPKPTYNTAPPLIPFLQETPAAQAALFHADPRNAAVICRCEGVTVGDILRALQSPIPPKTINGLKKRLRIGMGRCQGGFCTTRVIAVLSRALQCRPEEVQKSLRGSNPVKGRVK